MGAARLRDGFRFARSSCFIINASTIQSAGPAGFVCWILGFLTFLILGAIVIAQLGRMFPEEGSPYVWTHNALGPCGGSLPGSRWWPGILVLSFTGRLVVTLIQALASSALQVPWQQGLVILAVIWFSAIMSILRYRVTQNHVNIQFVFYAAAIFRDRLAGLPWLLRGSPSRYLIWGSLLVMAAHLWTTFGNYRRRPWLAGSGRSQSLCGPAARLACS